MGEAVKTDIDKLHATFALTTEFMYAQGNRGDCGCITRGDGQRLRRCQQHSDSLSMSGRPVKLGGG